ncbi:hypothetical protein ACW17M_06895 [Vreelandella sp. 2A-K22]
MIEAEDIDTWASILQRIVIISGVIISAWLFIFREESSPHVSLLIEPELMPECIIRVHAEVENKGGRVWNLETAIARVFMPSMERTRTPSTEAAMAIGTQIIKMNQVLKISETSSIGFNIVPNSETRTPFYIIKVAITIREEDDQWIRIAESSIKSDGC